MQQTKNTVRGKIRDKKTVEKKWDKFDVIKIKNSDRKVIKFLISSHTAIKNPSMVFFLNPCRRLLEAVTARGREFR